MPSPFPGMDPYLEDATGWRTTHHWWISAAAEQLQPQLLPRGYLVDIDSRVWLEGPDRAVYPDVGLAQARRPRGPEAGPLVLHEVDEPIKVRMAENELHEEFLEIRDQATRDLVTGIELISPSNKAQGKPRRLYIQKRRELQTQKVNLVEVDLLREGKPLVRVPQAFLGPPGAKDRYCINIIRPESLDYEFYSVPIRQRLPRVRIPLKAGEADAVLDLQAALARVYEAGTYAARIDYNQPPVPPLRGDDASWADALLVAAGLRTTPL